MILRFSGILDSSLGFQIMEIRMLESSSLGNVIFLFWRTWESSIQDLLFRLRESQKPL